MKYAFGIRIIVALVVAGLLVVAIFVIEYQQSQQKKFSQDQILRTAQRELIVIRSNLEADIYSDIFYANSLATILSASPDSPKHFWEDVSKKLYSKSNHLKNLGVAPDDVIQFVFPFEGNEAALGLDFRTIPEQWQTVQQAREQQSIFIAGPVNLVQGGIGLIARTPIFTDPPYNTQYWGTCSVVLDIESLFRAAGIYEVEQRYDFAIRGKNGKGALGEVFWGEASVFESLYASQTVVLPSGSWELAISLSSLYEQVPFYENNLSRIIGYPVMLLLIVVFVALSYFYHIAHNHSIHDELTRLPNRRYFIYTLEQIISDSRKKGSGFTLLNVDLDNFKSVNDTYGHAIGDKVLIEVAKRIKKTLRSSDIVARLGGDEFVIILPRVVHEDDIENIISNLNKAIGKSPMQLGYARITIEISIGHAVYLDTDVTADTLMTMADSEMYRDKRGKAQ